MFLTRYNVLNNKSSQHQINNNVLNQYSQNQVNTNEKQIWKPRKPTASTTKASKLPTEQASLLNRAGKSFTEQRGPSPSSEVLHRASNLNTEQAVKSSIEQATSTE
ncbi:hypothetical protein Droror1_Dr00023477 [Drosera rotundifolia]